MNTPEEHLNELMELFMHTESVKIHCIQMIKELEEVQKQMNEKEFVDVNAELLIEHRIKHYKDIIELI